MSRRFRRALHLGVLLILPFAADAQGTTARWRDTMRYATAEDALLHLVLERLGMVARPGRPAGTGPFQRFSLELSGIPVSLGRRVRERVQPLLDDSLRADSLGTFKLRLSDFVARPDTVSMEVTHLHQAGCKPRPKPYNLGLGSAGFSHYPAITVRDSSGWRLERRFQGFADGSRACP